MLKKIVSLVAFVVTMVAFASSASACFFGMYQPEEPKSLSEL
jgi:cyclic lactone autoinducer peptide